MKNVARLLSVAIPLLILAACGTATTKPLPVSYLTATDLPTLTPLPDSGLPAASPGLTSAPGCDTVLITDVSIPLDTKLSPGQAFTKSWQIQNTSGCDLGTDVSLVYLGGALMESPPSVPVPNIPTGQSATISLEMIAPFEPGTYASLWQLQKGDGVMFGSQLWVRIVVPGEAAPIPVPVATPEASDSCTLDAGFVTDVTIPDNTILSPGESFEKIWRIKNIGTCPWESGFQFTFIMGDAITDTPSVPVAPTAPGATVDVSVPMTAPSLAGEYTSIWSMQAPDGDLFGNRLFARIIVSSSEEIPRPATPVPAAPAPPAVISGITNRSHQIFLSGQQAGNRPDVFAKVGDSITATWAFMVQFGDQIEDLHEYSYLQPVIDYYRVETPDGGTSFSRTSFAAEGGWNSHHILDPSKANPICAGATPVECEYQRIKPSVSIIMIGTNDADHDVASGQYEANLRRVVEISIDMGVIPVLTTIPWNMYHDAPAYNDVIIRVARSYDIPLIDYWTLMEQAPERGLSEDDVHPSVPLDNNTVNFSADNLNYGFTIRNLVTLQMLDAIWRQVILANT
jgi:hypothetical protein